MKLSPAVEWLAIETARLVGLDVAGVDILIGDDTYKICEINSSPGFEGFELATGINVPRELLHFMQIRYRFDLSFFFLTLHSKHTTYLLAMYDLS